MNLSCHCGAIQIDVEKPPESLLSCNCSVCNRYGALWGYYKPDEVKITGDLSVVRKYAWGDKTTEFCHCRQCGCMTHYETNEKVESPVTALNFRMAELSAIESLAVRKFDGADTWKFLD